MHHRVFERLVEGIEAADHYFKHNEDAIGRLRLTAVSGSLVYKRQLLLFAFSHMVSLRMM
jgi:hypothetical protein